MVSTPCGPTANMALVHLYLPQVSLSCVPPSHSCALCFVHVRMENPVRGEDCTQPRWNRAQATGPGWSKSVRSRVQKFPDQSQGSELAGSYKDWTGWWHQTKGRLVPCPKPFGQLWACSRGWGDEHQGTAEHTQTCGSSACEPVCPCSHTCSQVCTCLLSTRVCRASLCGHGYACACKGSTGASWQCEPAVCVRNSLARVLHIAFVLTFTPCLCTRVLLL